MPACRVVLGVLPRLLLQLPDDPTGLMHSMACLVEGVVPAGHRAEQAADSQEGRTSRSGLAAAQPVAVAVRLTLFAAGERVWPAAKQSVRTLVPAGSCQMAGSGGSLIGF